MVFAEEVGETVELRECADAVDDALVEVRSVEAHVAVCAAGIARLQSIALGPIERYGEVLSGAFVALVGLYALLTA